MRKKLEKITFFHWILIVAFVAIGLLLSVQTENFQYRSQTAGGSIPFLPAGSYVLQATFDGATEPAKILVVSPDGMAETIVCQDLEQEKGTILIPFRVEEEKRNLVITTENVNDLAVDLQSTGLLHRDSYYLLAVCLLCALGIGYLALYVPMHWQKRVFLLLSMGLLSSLPLFSDSIMAADAQDLQFHLVRIEGIYKGLRALEFPVRINSVQCEGFGNLSATMYPQLFLYPAALLRLLGVSLMNSYKSLLIGMNIATAGIAYFAMKSVFRSNEKLCYITTLLYVFSAYRLSNLYFRAALGESLAMVFMPLLFAGAYHVLWGERKKWPLLVLGMTGILQSHVLTVEMCVMFLVLEGILWLGFSEKTEKIARAISLLKAVGVSILWNLSMLVPFVYYSTEDLQAFILPYRQPESVTYLTQLFSMFMVPQGYNLEPGTTQGEMPMSLGFVLLIGTGLFLAATVIRKDHLDTLWMKAGKRMLVYGMLAVLLSSWIFPWDTFGKIELFRKLTSPLQFTWRFLSPASFLFAFVAAVGFTEMAEYRLNKYIYGIMGCILMTSTLFFFDGIAHKMPQIADKLYLESLETSDSIYMYQETTEFTTMHDRYHHSDAKMMTKYSTPVEYSNYQKKGSHISVHIKPLSEEPDELMFPVYYYPGYTVYVDGQKVPCHSLVSWVTCELPHKECDVELKYTGFWFFKVADFISALSVIGFCMWKIQDCLKSRHIESGRA